MTVYVGTSGWQYAHWRGRFYPRRPQRVDELRYYGERFRAVELNRTFYRLPEAETFDDWAARTPSDFVFAVKASRFLTHMKRLRDPEEPVALLLDRSARLGRKLGPVLLQLPPSMERDATRLEATLAAFGGRARVAVEYRHNSWYTDEVRALLERHGAALCLADRGSRLLTPVWRTTDWGYLRMHEGRAAPGGCYGERALDARAALVARLFVGASDVFVFFNNDGSACAVRDARLFALAAQRHGLDVTRTPDAGDVRVG